MKTIKNKLLKLEEKMMKRCKNPSILGKKLIYFAIIMLVSFSAYAKK